MNSEQPKFEEALTELESIVQNLERGDISLDDSLAKYERGVGLLKLCFDQLKSAEARIQELAGIDEDGQPRFRPFAHNAATPDAPETKRGRRKASE